MRKSVGFIIAILIQCTALAVCRPVIISLSLAFASHDWCLTALDVTLPQRSCMSHACHYTASEARDAVVSFILVPLDVSSVRALAQNSSRWTRSYLLLQRFHSAVFLFQQSCVDYSSIYSKMR